MLEQDAERKERIEEKRGRGETIRTPGDKGNYVKHRAPLCPVLVHLLPCSRAHLFTCSVSWEQESPAPAPAAAAAVAAASVIGKRESEAVEEGKTMKGEELVFLSS